MTKYVAVRHGLGPIQTTDAKIVDDEAAVTRIMYGIKNSLGPLSASDAERVESILTRYADGHGSTADREQRVGNFAAQRARIQGIEKIHAAFWDKAAKEGMAW